MRDAEKPTEINYSLIFQRCYIVEIYFTRAAWGKFGAAQHIFTPKKHDAGGRLLSQQIKRRGKKGGQERGETEEGEKRERER